MRVEDKKAVANFYNQTTAKYWLTLGFYAHFAPHRFIFAMDQSLVLDAIGSFLRLCNYGRGASFPEKVLFRR
jgi:hypothetical protein